MKIENIKNLKKHYNSIKIIQREKYQETQGKRG